MTQWKESAKLILRCDLPYDAAHPQCLVDLGEPAEGRQPPLLIWFHGGGLENGDQKLGPELQDLVAEHGIAVASVGYRMYPQARFPEFIEDCARAIAWLVQEEKICERFEKVFIGGSSAGGYLSMMLYFAQHFLRDAGVDPAIIDGCIFNAGQPMSHYRVLTERGIDSRCVRVDDAAPLWYISESFAGKRTVPLLIVAADHDMVNRLEQNVVLKTALTHFDYPPEKVEFRVMEGYQHCAYDGARDAQGRYIFADIMADFIRRWSDKV